MKKENQESDALTDANNYAKRQEELAERLIHEITHDKEIINGYKISIKGDIFPSDACYDSIVKKMFKEEATDRVLVDRAILSGILKNEFIPNEIKKFLIIIYVPIFKAIGAVADLNLKNPREARNAEIIFWAINKKASEEKSVIVENSADGLTLDEAEVFNKIMSLAHGFEYSSRQRDKQSFSMITPITYSDSLNEMKQDMPIIKSLYEGLLESYNKFYSKPNSIT